MDKTNDILKKLKRNHNANKRPSAFDDCLRAEREDDDGYHPFADRPQKTRLFEPNPWD